jgi:hypothetical protein
MGIGQHLLAEEDALLAENEALRDGLAEARERAGSQLSPEQLAQCLRFIAKHCDRG